MSGFDWKETLATVAPMIATALGSPVAGVAVAAGLKAFGITPDADPASHEQQLATAIQQATPQQLLAMKAADQQFQKDMKSLNIDLAKINQEDRASARDMAVKTGRQPQIILSIIYTLAFAGVLFTFLSGAVNINAGYQSEITIILGMLTTAQTMIMQFWFGSSSGSKEKDAHLAAIAGSTK